MAEYGPRVCADKARARCRKDVGPTSLRVPQRPLKSFLPEQRHSRRDATDQLISCRVRIRRESFGRQPLAPHDHFIARLRVGKVGDVDSGKPGDYPLVNGAAIGEQARKLADNDVILLAGVKMGFFEG